MNNKMRLVLSGLVKVYDEDIKIINTFYKAFEYSENVPSEEKIIKEIGTLRKKDNM